MQISLLLEREPFPDILGRTLEGFLPQLTGDLHRVRWSPKSVSPDPEAQHWFCNHYVNAIFAKGAPRDVFRPVVGEFSRSSSAWRRPWQRGYVALASSSRFASILAQSRLEISPPITNSKDWLIVGGNHKVRLLNHRTLQCYSVLKEGFDLEFLRTEVSARRLATEAGVSVPVIRQVASDESWFLEDYVAGVPLNRLSSGDAAKRTLLGAMNELNRFSETTSRPMGVRTYTQSLAKSARASLSSARAVDASLRARVETCIGRLLEVLDPAADDSVTTARCHGDLQPGNILWRSDGHWIIDWEYAARRQAGHDTLVYQLQTRFPEGLAARLGSFVASGCEGRQEEDRSHRRRTARILCLEELELNLREIRNPLFFSVGDSFSNLVHELETWLFEKEGVR